jgi:hypothetical protein
MECFPRSFNIAYILFPNLVNIHVIQLSDVGMKALDDGPCVQTLGSGRQLLHLMWLLSISNSQIF